MSKKTVGILGICTILIVAAAVLIIVFRPAPSLAENEVRELLEKRYTGQVENMTVSAGVYTAEFHSPFGQYAIEVAAEDGRIMTFDKTSDESNVEEWGGNGQEENLLGLEGVRSVIVDALSEEASIVEAELVEENGAPYYRVLASYSDGSGTFEIDAETGEVLLYTTEGDGAIEPISEEEAVEIALNEHEGEVDDVDLEQRDGRLVFEIEIENDETGIDADIIIDAYSGEVLSVELD